MEIENLASPDDGVDGGMRITRRRRVAVIAIHGVADQKLGDTCQALAELLIAQTPNGFVYEPGVRQDEILQVKLLEPVLIAFLGVAIGGIVIAMYMPIFSLISKLGGQ